MFIFEPQGTLIMIALASTFILAFNLISKRGSSRWGLERQYFENQRNKHLLQGLGGIKDIKIYGKEIPFIESYQTNNSHNARINKNQTVVSQLPKVFLEFIVIITLSRIHLVSLLCVHIDLFNCLFYNSYMYSFTNFNLIKLKTSNKYM